MKYAQITLLAAIACCSCERKAPPGANTQSSAALVSASASARTPPAVASNPSSLASAFASPPPSTVPKPAEPAKPAVPAAGKYRELTWSFDGTEVGDMRAVVVIPDNATDSHRLPVLITMHGQGEALKGPEKGARGWVDDYWLPKALRRLHAPPLTHEDFRHLSEPRRLSSLNEQLDAQPYRGMIVVCPYTPFRLLKGERGFTDGKLLADFLVDVLIPKIYAELPAIGTPASTAVDGVSLGGRASVLVGLARPEAFGVLGALQPAFDVQDAERLANRAKAAKKKNPNLAIRLLTSEGDFYLESTKAISKAMDDAGVGNTLDIVAGDHSYAFNQGPGVYEMLLFHDRALRR